MLYKKVKQMWKAKRFDTIVFNDFFDDTLDNYIIKHDGYNSFNFVSKINLLVLGEKYMKLKETIGNMSWDDFQKEDVEVKLALYDKAAVFVFVDEDGVVTVGTLAQLLRRVPQIKDICLRVDSLYSRRATW